jgi:hypothetical protein
MATALAFNAGIDCNVITTIHRKEEFENYPNVLSFISNYN